MCPDLAAKIGGLLANRRFIRSKWTSLWSWWAPFCCMVNHKLCSFVLCVRDLICLALSCPWEALQMNFHFINTEICTCPRHCHGKPVSHVCCHSGLIKCESLIVLAISLPIILICILLVPICSNATWKAVTWLFYFMIRAKRCGPVYACTSCCLSSARQRFT